MSSRTGIGQNLPHAEWLAGGETGRVARSMRSAKTRRIYQPSS